MRTFWPKCAHFGQNGPFLQKVTFLGAFSYKTTSKVDVVFVLAFLRTRTCLHKLSRYKKVGCFSKKRRFLSKCSHFGKMLQFLPKWSHFCKCPNRTSKTGNRRFWKRCLTCRRCFYVVACIELKKLKLRYHVLHARCRFWPFFGTHKKKLDIYNFDRPCQRGNT